MLNVILPLFKRLSHRFGPISGAGLALILVLPAFASSEIRHTGADDANTSLTLYSPVHGIALDSSPAGPDDVLAKLRRNFSLQYVDNHRTAAEKKWFARHPEYLNRVFTRAQRYMPFIVEELERRNLPMELALLPIVESAYDPFAYSHGRAAGLWQMIPGTAKRFGVRQNWWYDGRRDIVESTRAALDYLEYLYKFNNGDWLNAIASYNSGEGNVRRAVRNNTRNGKPIDFWNLRLPERNQRCTYRSSLPWLRSSQTPLRHGRRHCQRSSTSRSSWSPTSARSLTWHSPQNWPVSMSTPCTSTTRASIAGQPTLQGHTHRLVMPIDVAEDFFAALQEVPANERVRWKRHKVRNGETISQIAERLSTPLCRRLRSANNLRGNTIRAGHHLLIPVASKPLSAYTEERRRAPRPHPESNTRRQQT